MSNHIRGQLAAVDVSTLATLTDVYTVPTSRVSDINITIANRADTDTNIRVAHIKNDVAANVAVEDYLLFDLATSSLASNYSPLSFTGIMMGAGDTISVYSSASAVSVQINGIEEDA